MQKVIPSALTLSSEVYPAGREGGSTGVALVPSLNALLFLLKHFGFADLRVLQPTEEDYEQYRRGSRVIVYGRKS